MSDTTKQLQLCKLELNLNRWGDNQGKYTGSIEYIGSSQETKLTLDPLISEELLRFIGPLIHKAAAKVAEDVQTNIQIALIALDNLNGQRVLEAPAAPAAETPPAEAPAETPAL